MRRSATLMALGFAVTTCSLAAAAAPVAPCQLLPVVLDVEASGTRYRTELSFTNPNRDLQDIAVTRGCDGRGDG